MVEKLYTPQELEHFVRVTLVTTNNGNTTQKFTTQPISGLRKEEAMEYAELLKDAFLKKWEKENIFSSKMK